MKRALVTGGCGFIGSNLTRELVRKGWMVDVVDNMSNGHIDLLDGMSIRRIPNSLSFKYYKDQVKNRKQDKVAVIEDDFESLGMLEQVYSGEYDVIFHQAAIPRVSYSVENPVETASVNVLSTIKLFEAASYGKVKRVVFASSSSVLGGSDDLPTNETFLKNPKSPYAWQKSCIEDYAKLCSSLYDLDIVCLRYFNVFGPGQYGDSPYATAVSAWCHAIKNDMPLRSDGDGEQSRDMCYVDNVVSANILAASSNRTFSGRVYNIACGDRVSNNSILNYFKKSYKVKIKNAPERPGDIKHTQADITRARDELGYQPLVRFWDGLDRTIKWWRLDEKS